MTRGNFILGKKKFSKVSIKDVLAVLFADLIVILVLLAVNLGLWRRVMWWASIPIGILTLLVLLIFSNYLLDRNARPCPVCGIKIDNKANFCTECGANVPKFCPSCKNKIKETPKFCQACGFDLSKTESGESIKTESTEEIKSISGYCGVCGGKVSEKAKYCPLCGSEQ